MGSPLISNWFEPQGHWPEYAIVVSLSLFYRKETAALVAAVSINFRKALTLRLHRSHWLSNAILDYVSPGLERLFVPLGSRSES